MRTGQVLFLGAAALFCAASVLFVFSTREAGFLPGAWKPAAADRTPPPSSPPPAVPAPAPAPEPEPAPPPAPPAVKQDARVEAPAPPSAPEEEEEEPEAAFMVVELLRPFAAEDRALTIHVQDAWGYAVERALVVVRDRGSLVWRARSDRTGALFFQPYQDEHGPFRVEAAAFGYETAVVENAEPGTIVTLTLQRRPELAGEVSAPSRGRGVVTVVTAEGDYETELAADNTFFFEDLPPGEALVQVVVDPFGSDHERVHLLTGHRHFVRLNVEHAPRVEIRGDIAFWPREGGDVRINGVRVDVRGNGSFRFPHAIYGLNEILVDAPGKALLFERFEVRPSSEKVSFTLQPEARIVGRVRSGSRNVPVAGAEVRLGVDLGDPRNEQAPEFPVELVPVVRADSDGRFEIARLDPRLIYLVTAYAPGYGQRLHRAVPGGGFLTVVAPEGPYLFGKLRGSGGIPRDAVVSATPIGERPGRIRFNVPHWDAAHAERGRDGAYGLSGLVAGDYLVRAAAEGFGIVEAVLEMREDERRQLDLRLRAGIATDPDEVELLQRLPSVEPAPPEGPPGYYTELHVDAYRREAPFDAISVAFFENDVEAGPRRIYEEPRFVLAGLPEGRYRAVLTHASLPKPLVEEFTLDRREPVRLEWFR